MAFPFHIKIHIILLLLTILSSSNKAQQPEVMTADLIRTICPKARNATICSGLLKDLTGTSVLKAFQHLLMLAASTCGDLAIYKFIAVSGVKNPELYKRYTSCIANYKTVVRVDFVEAIDILNTESDNYNNLHSKVHDAIREAETCDKKFDQPTSMDPSVKEITCWFQEFSSFALLLSNILAHRH